MLSQAALTTGYGTPATLGGGLLTYFAVPVFLDAAWAFLPAVFLAVTLVIRTKLEDRTLQDRLEGYSDYAKQVIYRLLPGVW
jgi:protein-S-isoprenylcysteine O-methyltransferase Ste14